MHTYEITAAKSSLTLREELKASDDENVKRVLQSSGFFTPEEVYYAVCPIYEMFNGPLQVYYFVIAEEDAKVVGYTCFNRITTTVGSYEVLWMAVHNNYRGLGVGTRMLQAAENSIRKLGGVRVFLETHSTPLYTNTRKFYEKCKYEQVGVLKNMYGVGDSSVVYVKELGLL